MATGVVKLMDAGARKSRFGRSAVEIMPAAMTRLMELLAKRPDSVGMRLGLKKAGCGGASFTMDYATAGTTSGDYKVIQDGIALYIDKKALLAVTGTQMDFVRDKLSSEFVFFTPNAEGVCGCGKSFKLRDDLSAVPPPS